MKKLLVSLIIAISILSMATLASATPYTFDMGPNSYVDTSGTNDVLQMWAQINPNLDDIIFGLDEGDTYSFYFATIGTNEGWIHNDDLNPGTITAYVDFDNPDLIQSIGGTSVGFSAYWHFVQGWNLVWNDPVVVNFGNGGQFTIELSDVGYESWWWQGPDGSANVYATVTLNAAPVPEPSTILLMGVGFLGMVGLGKKRLLKKTK